MLEVREAVRRQAGHRPEGTETNRCLAEGDFCTHSVLRLWDIYPWYGDWAWQGDAAWGDLAGAASRLTVLADGVYEPIEERIQQHMLCCFAWSGFRLMYFPLCVTSFHDLLNLLSMLLQFHGAWESICFTKEVLVLTKPLFLGTGASETLPTNRPMGNVPPRTGSG